MTSHSPYVCNLLHYAQHHILTLWHQTTVFMTSHPLYLTSYPLYLCHNLHCLMISHQLFLWELITYIWWHHIHCIGHHIHYMCNITVTGSVSSHPLFWYYHTLFLYMTSYPYLYKIIYTLYGITSTFYDIPPHYLWHHMHCNHITPTVSDIASSVSVPSQQIY